MWVDASRRGRVHIRLGEEPVKLIKATSTSGPTRAVRAAMKRPPAQGRPKKQHVQYINGEHVNVEHVMR